MRVYITGSQSTGKTTLARWIAETYQLKLITEVVRSILASQETSLDRMRIDVTASNLLQEQVFRNQLAEESAMRAAGEAFVSDRSLDFIAYCACWATNTNSLANHADFLQYVARLKEADAVVFFVRPHKELVKADGLRAQVDLAWEQVLRIDAMIELLLELYGIRYVAVTMLAMRDRVRLVQAVLDQRMAT